MVHCYFHVVDLNFDLLLAVEGLAVVGNFVVAVGSFVVQHFVVDVGCSVGRHFAVEHFVLDDVEH